MSRERVAHCMRRSIGGSIEVRHSAKNGTAHYSNLQTCGSVWMCPNCAAKITERRRQEVAKAVKAHLDAGGCLLFVTYTLRHDERDELGELVGVVNEAHRKMRGGSVWQNWRKDSGLVGTIRALEVTHGVNGWHPHIHELYLFSGKMTSERLLDVQGFLFGRWSGQLSRMGRDVNTRGVDVRLAGDAEGLTGYLAKAGWGLAEELAKASRKDGSKGGRSPQRLLSDAYCGDMVAEVLYYEYCKVFKGKKMLVWSRGLRVLLLGDEPEKTDEELAKEEQEDSVLLLQLDTVQFARLVALDLRSELLAVADGADVDAVRKWLFEKGVVEDG